MAGYLIKDTTRAEREQIVAESLGNIEATCDGTVTSISVNKGDSVLEGAPIVTIG